MRFGFLVFSAMLGCSTALGQSTRPEDWEARRQGILNRMQQVMGPMPTKWRGLPLEMQVLESADLPRYVRTKIRFRVEPEDRPTAWLLIPKDVKGKAPAMLCLHQTVDCGKDEPAGLGKNTELRCGQELAERGYVALCPDYWTFGDYRASTYDPYQHGYRSGTMKGIWTHMRCVDLLQSLPQVQADRVGCIGHSLGGHNALFLAAFDERIKAVVSSCGFSSFASYAGSKYGGGDLRNWAQKRYMPRIAEVYGNDPARMPFDWPEVLMAIAPRAVFVSAPVRDENFLIEGVKKCIGEAQPVFRLMSADGSLRSIHPQGGHSFPKEARDSAYGFLDQQLKQGSGGR